MFRGHGQNGVAHTRVFGGERQLVAGMHQVGYPLQAGPDLSAGMQHPEIGGRKPLALQQCDRDGVAQRERHCCRCRRCQAHRTAFRDRRQNKRDIGHIRHGAVGAGCNGDQWNGKPLGIFEQVVKFAGITRIRQGDDRVVAGDHAQVTMAGFAGVYEIGGGPGRCQGRCDLAGDMTAFPHAGHDDPSLDGRQDIQRRREPAVQRGRKRVDAICFQLQHP